MYKNKMVFISNKLVKISKMNSYTGLSFLRAVARSEILGGHVMLGGENVPSLVEIGLTDLSKSGGARALLAPLLATGLLYALALVGYI